jgi:hypothetical protein
LTLLLTFIPLTCNVPACSPVRVDIRGAARRTADARRESGRELGMSLGPEGSIEHRSEENRVMRLVAGMPARAQLEQPREDEGPAMDDVGSRRRIAENMSGDVRAAEVDLSDE